MNATQTLASLKYKKINKNKIDWTILHFKQVKNNISSTKSLCNWFLLWGN